MADPDATSNPDPRVVVAEIETEAARKRAAGEYPPALLKRLRADFGPGDELGPPEICAVIESSRPLRYEGPVVGSGIVFAKRVVRRLLAWYVAPIAMDQTRFNLSILRDLRALERRLDKLENATPGEADGEAHPRPASADR